MEGYLGAVAGDAEVGVLTWTVTIFPAWAVPTRSRWRVTMMTPSRGTLRWTLTGPGAGAGRGAPAILAPRSLARSSAGTGDGKVLARTPYPP